MWVSATKYVMGGYLKVQITVWVLFAIFLLRVYLDPGGRDVWTPIRSIKYKLIIKLIA
jgi:hypothetical protein